MNHILDDAQARHRANPKTFEVPDLEALQTLVVGDHVKLIFIAPDGLDVPGERMWVRVTSVTNRECEGELINRPYFLPLRFGDRVSFRRKHICDIRFVEELEGDGESTEQSH